jgi:hypothetical protein
MDNILMTDQISNIQQIKDILEELSKNNILPHPIDIESCKELIRDYFINIKPSLKEQ